MSGFCFSRHFSKRLFVYISTVINTFMVLSGYYVAHKNKTLLIFSGLFLKKYNIRLWQSHCLEWKRQRQFKIKTLNTVQLTVLWRPGAYESRAPPPSPTNNIREIGNKILKNFYTCILLCLCFISTGRFFFFITIWRLSTKTSIITPSKMDFGVLTVILESFNYVIISNFITQYMHSFTVVPYTMNGYRLSDYMANHSQIRKDNIFF